MAICKDAKGRRGGWVMPVLSFATGAGVSLVVGLLLTRTEIPAMVAVDEVALVVPEAVDPVDVFDQLGGTALSDWSSPRGPAIRGNVIEMADRDNPDPIITSVSASIDGSVRGSMGAAMETVPVAMLAEVAASMSMESPEVSEFAADPNIRWFNARPARPARTIWMTVTGYSPDERSCGDSADGLTATMHSVTTNAMKLVAADPTVLPYGSMVSIPGYDTDSIVPVLDCGGAIKGDKLDLLFPTHEEALKWGRQRVLVTIWEYADGLPAENVRKAR